MRYRVEGFTEVQHFYVCLLPGIVGLEEIMLFFFIAAASKAAVASLVS